MTGSNVRGALLALLAMAIYAMHDVAVKALGAGFSAPQIMFFAATFSFPLVMIGMVPMRGEAGLRPVHPGWVAGRAVAVVLNGVLAFYAFAVLPLAQVYAFLFTMPLIITALSVPILGEPVGPRRWIAVLCGLVGVLIVLRPGMGDLTAGHLAALGSALAGAFGMVVVRRIGETERPMALLAIPLLANFLAMGAVLPFVYRPMALPELGLMAVVASFGLAAMWLSILSYRAGEAVIVAPMQYSQMLWAIGFGWFLFHETPDVATLIGAGVIIASGVYIVAREARARASLQPVLNSRLRPETEPRPDLLPPADPPG
ncbi:DMT family transporter [Phaeovulum vinaykumarii]|uniref:S-adenosylmethionine uptake transporter n=1 Tax=Phaeovulum vinaykumarii TaxID=407234 RepID=A0A1N7KR38_9RHOB|nr:DMT family transporter [Phaeovulum vinaykumarii]SIS64068.1 S-adenosylmethionine uptake transporter [Phaeovulum vinaykumarii]SOC01686.1 S-adenosylmethionine uptake transporter [Phaeovulum vinaykumarii]